MGPGGARRGPLFFFFIIFLLLSEGGGCSLMIGVTNVVFKIECLRLNRRLGDRRLGDRRLGDRRLTDKAAKWLWANERQCHKSGEAHCGGVTFQFESKERLRSVRPSSLGEAPNIP